MGTEVTFIISHAVSPIMTLTASSTQSSSYWPRALRPAKRAAQLNIMVCGRPGTGKSTFVNSLCDAMLVSPNDGPRSADDTYGAAKGVANGAANGLADGHADEHLSFCQVEAEVLAADGTQVGVSVVEVAGLGARVDSSMDALQVNEFLESKHDEVLHEEALLHRTRRFKDPRVHVCLYFLPPTAGGLRELDERMLRELAPSVNVILVIGMADTVTRDELARMKQAVRTDLADLKLGVFEFTNDDLGDAEYTEALRLLREMQPFAVCGSNETVPAAGGGRERARTYPWGVARIADEAVSDFAVLRRVLFETHLEELRDSTQEIYENYRTGRLIEDPELHAKLRAAGHPPTDSSAVAGSVAQAAELR